MHGRRDRWILPRVPDAPSGWFGRFVGGILITEGVLVAILRFISLVYVVASEAFNADRFRTPLSDFPPSVLIAGVITFALIWAGSFLRREPSGAWTEVGTVARAVLVIACQLNVAALAMAVAGLVATPATVEGSLTWIVIGATSTVAIVGLVRDVTLGRARV
jgi:hypothetical protein